MHYIETVESISVLSFFHNFQTAWDSNGVHKRAAVWCFQPFMKEIAKATLSHIVCAAGGEERQSDGELTFYRQIVNCLLETYATDDVIAKIEADLTWFKRSESMTAITYTKVLCGEALPCDRVHDESRLK